MSTTTISPTRRSSHPSHRAHELPADDFQDLPPSPSTDRDLLIKNCEGNVELALALLVEFEKTIQVRLETINAALVNDNSAMIGSEAHSLKGVAGILAFNKLMEICSTLESTSSDTDWNRMHDLLRQFRDEVQHVRQDIPNLRVELESRLMSKSEVRPTIDVQNLNGSSSSKTRLPLEGAKERSSALLANGRQGVKAILPLSARVLIVDDEPISRKMVQFALEQKGFECDLAEDGLAAQKQLVRRRYDVVVTDLLMPNINGGELIISLCAQLRRPIVVVHTAVLEGDVTQGLKREGVDLIIHKPADFAEMAEKIQKLVERPRSRPAWLGGSKKPREALAPTKPYQTFRLFVSADDWIQNRPFRREAFRFGIVVLACLLFGLGWGPSLTPQMAGICKMFGLTGLAFYFSLELVAYYRERSCAKLLQYAAERRLSASVPRT